MGKKHILMLYAIINYIMRNLWIKDYVNLHVSTRERLLYIFDFYPRGYPKNDN